MSQVYNLTDASAAVFRDAVAGKLRGVNLYNGAAIRIAVREGSATGRVLLVADITAAGVVTEEVPGERGADFDNTGLWVTVESGSPTNLLLQVYVD